MVKDIIERLDKLRTVMRDSGWDAVVLRGSDPHASEYLAPRYQCVTFLSGFTGEAGDIAVTADHAGLWTDSRYFIQAAAQLEGTGFVLHKTRLPESVGIEDFLASAPGVHKVAVDSLCESASLVRELQSKGLEVIGVEDLVDAVWEDRPALAANPVISLDESTVGRTRIEKIGAVREAVAAASLSPGRAPYFLVTALDDIAWTLNVRGSDIDFNPLVFSYLLVGPDSVQWFVLKPGGITDEDTADTVDLLQSEGVSIENYSSILPALRLLAEDGETVAYDPSTTNASIAMILGESGLAFASPIPLMKAVKTREEIAGMREAHLEDGLAMEQFIYWLETQTACRSVSEWEASQKLHNLRERIPGYRGDSFETISAWGAGGALPHYATPHDDSTFIPRITPDANPLNPEESRGGLYLCDSGGQYLFGTTDITRTIPLGQTSFLEKEDYTLVLKGMIDLSMAVFPEGTAGCQIDALAREPLWRNMRSFGHGTGHGIGFFLCVHEGPQSIRQNFLQQPLIPGMITSNEPALYREGRWGVRHENVILCREEGASEFGRFLSFETLTLCHFDTAAVLPQLLTRQERQWLDEYNERVYDTYAAAIEDEDFLCWLRKKTLPIE